MRSAADFSPATLLPIVASRISNDRIRVSVRDSNFRIWYPRGAQNLRDVAHFHLVDTRLEGSASSSRLIGPISPPLALEAASESSAASLGKGSPASSRFCTSSASPLAASSSATLTPRSVTGNLDQNLPQRDFRGRREVLWMGVVVGARASASVTLILSTTSRRCASEASICRSSDSPEIGHRHALLLQRRLELLLVFEVVRLPDVRRGCS